MSPTQAAQATGTSRRTVMRAIEAQELLAFRDNRNHWKITPQAIEMWASAQCAPTGQMPTLAHSEQPDAHPMPILDAGAELQAEREARRQAEVEAGQLRGKLAATEAERDRLHSLVERLTTPQAKRHRWWPF
ncbi:helix-turn-helix domain-containing protein [Paracoccus aestuarii]